MARFFMVILVLVPALCAAEPWSIPDYAGVLGPPKAVAAQFSWPIRISDVSVKPLLAKQTVGLRDEIDLTNRGTIPQLSVAAELPGWCELRYLGRPRCTWDETVTPVGPVQVGSVIFNEKNDSNEDKTTPKPIELQWWTLSHQFELVGRTSWPIQPYVVAHLHQFELTGRSEKTEATERWEKWFPGIGVAFRVPFLKAEVQCKAAAWKDFSMIDVGMKYSPIPYVSVGLEYLREDVRIGNLHHRLEGPMASVGVQF
jgi:hypothetical protein